MIFRKDFHTLTFSDRVNFFIWKILGRDNPCKILVSKACTWKNFVRVVFRKKI